MAEKQIQERLVGYRLLESRLDALFNQRDLVANKILEIQTTLESVDEISKSDEEILFPVGSEAYTFGRAVDKAKLIVEVGAGVALEKTVEEGKQILNKRKEELQEVLQELLKNADEVAAAMESLQTEIEGLASKSEEPKAD